MTARAQVRALADAPRSSPSPGVEVAVLSRSADDPSVQLERTQVAAGATTKAARSAVDQRVLVEGSGQVTLNGVAQPVAPGDMVMIPRGAKVAFEADRDGPLTLWTVASPGAGAGVDAPMQCGAGVLSEDVSKEFFVGEGVSILERANSSADPGVGFDRARAPAGMTTALHRLKIDERYLITRGSGAMEFDGVKREVKAGDVVLIPRGTAQRITAGEGGVDFYCVTTPRFLTEDYDQHLADAFVDPARYDGSAGPLEAVQAKLQAS
jgi:mannose-6-phosphate isomerase-like protein (cupin superfamily)